MNSLAAPTRDTDARNQQLNTLLQDVERPKGLYIYHGMYFKDCSEKDIELIIIRHRTYHETLYCNLRADN